MCVELESVCSERKRMCISMTIEIESVCEYRERKECVYSVYKERENVCVCV